MNQNPRIYNLSDDEQQTSDTERKETIMSNVTQKKVANMSLLNAEQTKKYDAQTSIASKIRYMLSLKIARGDISRYMTEKEQREVRYQWVRNVELTPVKKS